MPLFLKKYSPPLICRLLQHLKDRCTCRIDHRPLPCRYTVSLCPRSCPDKAMPHPPLSRSEARSPSCSASSENSWGHSMQSPRRRALRRIRNLSSAASSQLPLHCKRGAPPSRCTLRSWTGSGIPLPMPVNRGSPFFTASSCGNNKREQQGDTGV